MQFARPFALLLCGLLAGANVRADAVSDLARYSAFPSADLDSLAGGKVEKRRGPTLGNARDLSVQQLYLMHAPVAKALEFHKNWDAARHPELKIYVHRDLPSKPSPANFSASFPDNSAVRALVAATLKLPEKGELQMSDEEAKAFHGGDAKAVHEFWSHLLYERASKGLGAQPPYNTKEGAISPANEIKRLLSEQPNVRAAFAPVIGGGVQSGSPYWQLFDDAGQANFLLGAANSRMNGDSAQLIDLQYYASGGDYALVTLYQMWPVTVGGQAATLVWRVDCISSAAFSGMDGSDRIGAAAALSKEFERETDFLLKDAGTK